MPTEVSSSPRRSARAYFTLLSATYGLSTFGNFLNLLAVNLYVLHLTGDAFLTGLLMAVRLTAAFAAGPVAGLLAARFPRRTIMIRCDVAQALAMVSLLVTPASSHRHLLWLTAVVLGAGNTVFMVALRTSVPELTGAADRSRGNGSLVTARAFGTVLGFAAAAPLIGAFGYGAAFAVNGATFVVSAIVLRWMPLSFGERPAPVVEPTARPSRGPRVLLLASPAVAMLLALRGVEGLAGASHNVALPVFAAQRDPAAPAVLLSQFWTAWAVGSLSMNRLVQWWLKRGDRRLGEHVYAGATACASAGFIAAFLDLPVLALVLVAAFAGFADGLGDLSYATLLQARPAVERAQLFGTSAAVETLGLASGSLGSAVLLGQAAPLSVVALFHAFAIAAAVVYIMLGSITGAKQ